MNPLLGRESSAMKDKSKKTKVLSAAILCGSLRVKNSKNQRLHNKYYYDVRIFMVNTVHLAFVEVENFCSITKHWLQFSLCGF